MRDVTDLVRQSLLDEHHGNIPAAFEDACRRMAVDFLRVEQLEAEVAQWRRGASLAYLRRKQASGPHAPIDVPPNPVVDPTPDA